uniref:Uncharacterized protein n=1 Tax=Oryza sativa subsp. japonica TaxID=39947 RepID=Q8H857_ORYSJ|nr:hypothetical protein [Oryza sativa Japonica Group]
METAAADRMEEASRRGGGWRRRGRGGGRRRRHGCGGGRKRRRRRRAEAATARWRAAAARRGEWRRWRQRRRGGGRRRPDAVKGGGGGGADAVEGGGGVGGSVEAEAASAARWRWRRRDGGERIGMRRDRRSEVDGGCVVAAATAAAVATQADAVVGHDGYHRLSPYLVPTSLPRNSGDHLRPRLGVATGLHPPGLATPSPSPVCKKSPVPIPIPAHGGRIYPVPVPMRVRGTRQRHGVSDGAAAWSRRRRPGVGGDGGALWYPDVDAATQRLGGGWDAAPALWWSAGRCSLPVYRSGSGI